MRIPASDAFAAEPYGAVARAARLSPFPSIPLLQFPDVAAELDEGFTGTLLAPNNKVRAQSWAGTVVLRSERQAIHPLSLPCRLCPISGWRPRKQT